MGIFPQLCSKCDRTLHPGRDCDPADIRRALRNRAEALGTPTLWIVPERPRFPLLEAINEVDDADEF